MSSNKGPEDSNPLSDLTNEPTQADEFDPLIGKRVQKYSIVSRVARGGTATVYRANDTVLNREVAFKILHEHLESRREVVERFRNEAKVVASLRHPNIVNVYDFFEFEGRAVLVAEFMPGVTLSQLIKQYRRLPENQVLMMANEILQGLKAAHDKGITHRDIKPANILVHPELGIKISDFGLAKLVHADDGLTKEGIFIGTPSFSSPEQIEGKPLDHRSDIFSLGLCLYMMASGSHAFKQKGDTTTTVWFKIVRGNFQGVREINPDLSPELEKILDRSLQVKPEKRYQTAKEMMNDIQSVLKRRKVFPYDEKLQDFLQRPFASHQVSKSKFVWKKTLKLSAVGILFLIAVGALVYFEPWKQIPPPEPEVSPAEQSMPEEVEPAPQPVPAPELVPAPAPGPMAPAPRPAPRTPVSKFGQQAVTALSLPQKALLVTPVGENLFALRFQWPEMAEFFLSTQKTYEPSLVRAEFEDKTYDWVNWKEGQYFWKAGDLRGQILIETTSSYLQRTRVEKRDLIVSSQYNEVDLQINPWMQQIRLSWESGPSADLYRLEVASDAAFKDLIYSGTTLTKWESIERLWEKDGSIFWRVSYMDAGKNVFFKEPVRQINLKLSVSAPHFEIVTPVAYDKLSPNLTVRALGPRQSKFRCALIQKGSAIKDWKDLSLRSGYFVTEFKNPQGSLLCEGQKEAESSFLFVPLEN